MVRTATVKYIQTYARQRRRDVPGVLQPRRRPAKTRILATQRCNDHGDVGLTTHRAEHCGRPTLSDRHPTRWRRPLGGRQLAGRRPRPAGPLDELSAAPASPGRPPLSDLAAGRPARCVEPAQPIRRSSAVGERVDRRQPPLRHVPVQAVTAGQLDEPVGRQRRARTPARARRSARCRPVRSSPRVSGAASTQHRHVAPPHQVRDVPAPQARPQAGRHRGRRRPPRCRARRARRPPGPSADGRAGSGARAGPGPDGPARCPARPRAPAPRQPAGHRRGGSSSTTARAEARLPGDRADRGRGPHAVPDEQVDRPVPAR